MLLTCAILGLILLIWFKTDAWVEYCRLLRLDFLSFYKDFDEKQYNDVSLTYHIYLRRYHNCFFVRLITCPICLAIWLSLIYWIAMTIGGFALFLTLSFSITAFFLWVGFSLGVLLTVPFIILGSLLVFAIIDRLLG